MVIVIPPPGRLLTTQYAQVLAAFTNHFTVVVRCVDVKGVTVCHSLPDLGELTLRLNSLFMSFSLDLMVDFGIQLAATTVTSDNSRLFVIPMNESASFPVSTPSARLRVYPHLGNSDIAGRSITFDNDAPLPMGVSKARMYLHDLEASVRRAGVRCCDIAHVLCHSNLRFDRPASAQGLLLDSINITSTMAVHPVMKDFLKTCKAEMVNCLSD